MDTYRPNENVTVVVDGMRMHGTVTSVGTDTHRDGPMLTVSVGGGIEPVRVRAREVSHVRRGR